MERVGTAPAAEATCGPRRCGWVGFAESTTCLGVTGGLLKRLRLT